MLKNKWLICIFENQGLMRNWSMKKHDIKNLVTLYCPFNMLFWIWFTHSWRIHSTEKNPIYVFPEMKLHRYMHVSVSYLFIPRIGLPILLQPILGIYKSLTDTWIYNSVLEIKRPSSFISGDTSIETRHLYWILTCPSFTVYELFIDMEYWDLYCKWTRNV